MSITYAATHATNMYKGQGLGVGKKYSRVRVQIPEALIYGAEVAR